MKICTKCKETKELSGFGGDKKGKGGLASRCRVCIAADKRIWKQANKERETANNKVWREANKGHMRAYNKNYYESNKGQIKAYSKTYYQKNKEQMKAGKKAWDQANPDKSNAHTAKRRAAKLQRTPSWLTTEDWNKINHMYSLAAFMTKQTGVKHEVDHIIPLQGETISGLHHPDNLQILTKSENCSKGNRLCKN